MTRFQAGHYPPAADDPTFNDEDAALAYARKLYFASRDDYPLVGVWALDDGALPWLKTLLVEGAYYEQEHEFYG